MIRQIWFQNRQNIQKIAPENEKNPQNAVFNLKGRISFLYYCVKHIHEKLKLII
jgi:hypothetical protein